MPKKYPVLTLSEILEIVKNLGLVLNNTVGSHGQWVGTVNGKTVRVTVDNAINEFGIFLIKSMISQANVSRKQFYSLSKSACKKINLKHKKSL